MAGGDPSSPNKKDATTQPYRRADKVKGKTVYQKQAEKKYGSVCFWSNPAAVFS